MFGPAAIISIIIVVVIPAFLYNSLIWKRNQVDNVFSTVDVLLQKRYDLIPNLVATVKGYVAHEKDVFEKISELRTQALSPNLSNDEIVKVNNNLSSCISSLFALTESYPQLKANTQFLKLQAALCEVEEQISAGRRAYNAAVTDYNNALQMFPSNIMASAMDYTPMQLFEANPASYQNHNWYSDNI